MSDTSEATAPVRRGDYPHLLEIPTRWRDNDVYGHVNNVEYYAFFDTVINAWLIEEGGLDIHRGDVIGLCAESHCALPRRARVPGRRSTPCCGSGRLGTSSVTYELAPLPAGG